MKTEASTASVFVLGMKSDCKDGGSSLDGRLYDEFRLSELGHLVHEIEWAQDAHWIIAANDIDFRWIPINQE